MHLAATNRESLDMVGNEGRRGRRERETNKGGNVIWSSRLPSVNLTSWWWPENRFTDQDWLAVRPALEILTDSWLLSYFVRGRGNFPIFQDHKLPQPRLWNRNRRLEDGFRTMETGSMIIDVKIKFWMLIVLWLFWIVDGSRMTFGIEYSNLFWN